MILVIGDKKYPGVAVDELSIRHTLALQRELAVTNISSAKTWADVRALLVEFQQLDKEGRQNHPEALFLSALTIWAARVSAGEEMGLLDAVDIPAASVRWIAEPSDKAPAGKARPRRSPGAPKAQQ